jgi:hypothetical protein
MKLNKILALAISLSISTLAQTANAAPILDQSNLGGSYGGWPAIFTSGSSFQVSTQTVTAGLSGVLTRVDLSIGKYSGFGALGTGTLNVKNSANTIVATSNFSVASLGEFSGGFFNIVSFDLSSQNFAIASGDIFKLELSHDAGGWLAWNLTTSPYSGGSSFVTSSGGTSSYDPQDYRFATYVDSELSANVPTPGALALLGLGLLGISGLRRNSSRSHSISI